MALYCNIRHLNGSASVDPLHTAEIGSTGLRVTRLGLGGATLGRLAAPIEASAAVRTILHAHHLGIRYFDTAPFYGNGRSEVYFGEALPQISREQFTLSTKVGRLLKPVDEPPNSQQSVQLPNLEPVFDFSRDGVIRSLEESLRRLNLDSVEILFIHDPDEHYEQALEQAFPALADLRSQGVVRAIGAGINQWEMAARFAREADFDCFLLAGRYTLLDQTGLEELLPICEQKGISGILGGPYNSGILASDLSDAATFDYIPAAPEILLKARRIKAVCDAHGVPLKAAALQFGLAHPAVASTIPGARSVPEVEENLEMASQPIPRALWQELRVEGLVHKDAPTPEA